MGQKTWRIGENATGGIITVDTTATQISIYIKDWKTSNVIGSYKITVPDYPPVDFDEQISMLLQKVTTPFYADDIVAWLKTQVVYEKVRKVREMYYGKGETGFRNYKW